MPKTALYTLSWSSQQGYQVQENQNKQILPVLPDSPDWYDWLEQITLLNFEGQHGRYTLRKEAKQRGDLYWYAYRSQGKRLAKKYVGKTPHVNTSRLEAIAVELADEPQQELADILSTQKMPLSAPSVAQKVLPPRDILLATKLHIPALRTRFVPRPHLLARLKQYAEATLVLISAPAGFGKTTLLAQWAAQTEQAVTWLSLETEDEEPVRFFSYLIAMLQTLYPSVGIAAQIALQAPQPAALETVLLLLCNDLAAQVQDDCYLVLDDYHVVNAKETQQAMRFLLEHIPAPIHFIIATRTDPPFPLARLRTRNQLQEMRVLDLRFDTAEVTSFFRGVMQLELSSADIALLEKITEGWVASLQLAALSLREKSNISAYLHALSGNHRFILDYLSDEVLAHLSEPVLTFLLHTSVLDRLSAGLCAALMDWPEEEGLERGQAMLEALDKANLFVVSLDEERHWYRYHHLFLNVLQMRLQQAFPSLVLSLHQRASIWYEQQGYWREAIHHALLIKDASLLARLLRPVAWDMLFRGEYGTLLGWLEKLPEALEYTQPFLCFLHAAVCALLGQAPLADKLLLQAEAIAPAEGDPLASPAEIAAIRSVSAAMGGNVPLALMSAYEALNNLAPEQFFLRITVMCGQSVIFALCGDFRQAITLMLDVRRIWQQTQTTRPFNMIVIMHSLALFQFHLGQLRQAIETCQEGVRLATLPSGYPLAYAGSLYVTLGEVLYERNQHSAAIDAFQEGIKLCKQTGEASMVATAYAALARIKYYEQRAVNDEYAPSLEVLDLMQQAENLIRAQSPLLFWTRNAAAPILVRLWLKQNNVEAVERLIQDYPIDEQQCSLPGSPFPYQREAIILAWLRLGKKQPEDTLRLLEWPIQDASKAGRLFHLVRMHLLQALAYEALDVRDQALLTLKQAVTLAEPEGFMRMFVEEGEVMQRLLLELRVQQSGLTRDGLARYLSRLLHAFEPRMAADGEPPLSARNMLSAREQEILRCMANGLSNQEIARQLVLERSTVQWHIGNIYSKLQVKSRVQALLKVQEADLS